MKQQVLFKATREIEFGGSLGIGKRKTRRPIFCKLPNHLVLKSTNPYILLRHRKKIEQLVHKWAKEFSIKIYELAVHTDHIHLLIQGSKENYIRWVRTITGMLTRTFKIKWKYIPYTKLVTWGRQFQSALDYVRFNKAEGDFIFEAHQRVDLFRKGILIESP
jgi:REP element-mobilizing transposase RayT